MKGLTALVIFFLAACTTPGSRDCEADWGSLGQRDGRLGAGSQAERYAAKCGKPVDAAAYEEGYRQGSSLRPYVPSF
jgi:hypothetical protein